MELFNKLARGAEEVIHPDDGDFVQNGLLHCGKCRTPKQHKVTVFGSERTVFCLCKCAAEARRKEDEEYEKRQQIRRVRDLRQWGFTNDEMAQWTFDKDDRANPKLTSWARSYVRYFPTMLAKGKGVVLYGPVGTGKTFAAACVANALIDEGHPVLMTSFSRIGNVLQGEKNKQDYLDEFGRYDLLVIDDLGAERNTSFMDEVVYNTIDTRYRQQKPLIVTTNYTRDEIDRASDVTNQRVFSRLFEMCTFMPVPGNDRRRAINRQNRQETERMEAEDDLF